LWRFFSPERALLQSRAQATSGVYCDLTPDENVQWYGIHKMSDPISITTFVLGLVDRGIKVLGWFKKKLSGQALDPSMGISFVPETHRWHMAGVANEPAMQLVSEWWMTNNTEMHVFILRAEIVFRDGLRWKVINQTQIIEKVDSGTMGEVQLFFWIVPASFKDNQDLKARIVLIDNFNRRHKAGRVIFKSPKTRTSPN
jgi:hypothetical protein